MDVDSDGVFDVHRSKRKSRHTKALEKLDHFTIDERSTRLKWLESVYPSKHGFMMSVDTYYIFSEVRMTFVGGQHIATVLLAASFIEHWLGSYLGKKGFVLESEKGLAAIFDCLRQHELMHPYLLDKIDEIRKLRNPFVHLKSPKHEHNLIQRYARSPEKPMPEVMEEDAKKALIAMYTVATSKLY